MLAKKVKCPGCGEACPGEKNLKSIWDFGMCVPCRAEEKEGKGSYSDEDEGDED